MPRVPNPRKPTVKELTADQNPPASMNATLTSTLDLLRTDEPFWSNVAKVLGDKLDPVAPDEPEEPVCARCKGAQWVIVRSVPRDHVDYGKKIPCVDCAGADMAQRSLDRKMKLAGVSDTWAGWTFDSYRNHPLADPEAADFVEEWARNGERSLFLYGPVGRGKTGLSIPAFRLRIAEGRAPTHIYLRSIDLFRRLWASNRKDADTSDSDITEAVCECALLLLDDIGVEIEGERGPSDYVKRKLYEIIGDRHDHGLATIFTTNLSLAELEKGLGDRTYWRILEMCEDNLYYMGGANLRDKRLLSGGAPQ